MGALSCSDAGESEVMDRDLPKEISQALYRGDRVVDTTTSTGLVGANKTVESNTKAAVLGIIVVVIAGVSQWINTNGFTSDITCPDIGCSHDNYGHCSVLTGACRYNLCVASLKPGNQCAEGWTNGKTGQTCNPDTCQWNP
jgi:hypothetical protein